MPLTVLILTLVLLSVAGFYMGRSRALAGVGGAAGKLHSRPHYYGYYVAIWCGLPAALVLLGWISLEVRIVEMLVTQALPPDLRARGAAERSLLINDIRNLATGNIFAGDRTSAVEDLSLIHI